MREPMLGIYNDFQIPKGGVYYTSNVSYTGRASSAVCPLKETSCISYLAF
jgi:hypothetical protein